MYLQLFYHLDYIKLMQNSSNTMQNPTISIYGADGADAQYSALSIANVHKWQPAIV